MKSYKELGTEYDDFKNRKDSLDGDIYDALNTIGEYDSKMYDHGIGIYGSHAHEVFRSEYHRALDARLRDKCGECIDIIQFLQKFMDDNPID